MKEFIRFAHTGLTAEDTKGRNGSASLHKGLTTKGTKENTKDHKGFPSLIYCLTAEDTKGRKGSASLHKGLTTEGAEENTKDSKDSLRSI